MKTRFTHHLIMILVSLFINTNSFGQEPPSLITIHVEKAGTLSSYIADSKKYQISNLKLSGCLNGSDFSYLREMENLEVLDLKDITIIEGDAYIYAGVSDGFSTYFGGTYSMKNNTISRYLFSYYKKLTKIIIPNSVNEISEDAFGSLNLKDIIVDDCHLYYSDINGVLFNKDKTKLLAYPRNANIIYTVPESVSEISEYAFHKGKLKSINIPYAVKTIGSSAFGYCENLISVTMSNSVETIGDHAFYNCKKLNSIKLSNKLTSIARNTFRGCDSLKTIVIPEGVTSIEDSAFGKLSHISIPSTMKKFGGISSPRDIEEIHCYASNPPDWNYKWSEYNKLSDKAILYVPKGTSNAYWLAKGWGEFKNIVEMDYVPTSNESKQLIPNLDIVSNRGGISIEVNESTPIQLYDINGKLIWNKTFDGYTTIPLSKGVYVVHTKEQSYKVMVY